MEIALNIICIILVITNIYLLLKNTKQNKIINEDKHTMSFVLKEIPTDRILELTKSENTLKTVQDIIYNMRINLLDQMQFADNIKFNEYLSKITGLFELDKQIEFYVKTAISLNNK